MASANLGITFLTTSQSNKETTTNDALQRLEDATQEYVNIDLTGVTTYTFLAADWYANFLLEGTGNTANVTFTLPASKRFFSLKNETGFSFFLTFDGVTVLQTLPTGSIGLYFSDGTTISLLAESTGTPVTAIDDLSDVDTTTTSPTVDDILAWDGSNWVPTAGVSVIDWKDSVRLALDANVDITTALVDSATFQTITVATGDRVLLTNQTTASENGIYIVAASGAASRATDADANAEVTSGLTTYVEEGTYSGSLFILTTTGTIVVDTTSLTFSEFSAGSVTSIDDLSDVDTTTSPPSTNDVLAWDGSNWTPATPSSGASIVDWKDSVRLALNANVDITTALVDGATFQTITVATGDRVLLTSQTTGSENGIYIVAASGAASRSTDADTDAEVTSGLTVYVEEGTYSGSLFVLTTTGTIVVDTTSLTFSALSAGSVTSIDDLSDVDTTTTSPVTNDALIFDGSNWVPVDTNVLSINNQTGTTYTLVIGDGIRKYVRCNNASAITLTVPPNSSVAFAVGTTITINQVGAGQVTVAAGGGVTINTAETLLLRAQHSSATLIKVATDEWDISGDLQVA